MMRPAKALTLAVALAAVLGGYPWVLTWALIADPSPEDVRRQAAALISLPSRRISALDSQGNALELAPADIAAVNPGPCLREHETEGFGRRGYEVRVTHWCRIDLTLTGAGSSTGTSSATAGLIRQQWLGAPPDGLHEEPLLAEPHELPVLMQRLGG